MAFDTEDGLALADVISAIKRELQIYEHATNDGKDLGLELADVTVALAVKNIRKADGSIGFGISFFGLGGKVGGAAEVSSESVSTLTVELAPPKQKLLMAADDRLQLDLATTLIDARAQLIAGLEEEPRLVPASLKLEIKFVVTKGGGPTGEFEFKILSGKAGATASRADTQTITLTFQQPEDL
jgi:hypothetical protein